MFPPETARAPLQFLQAQPWFGPLPQQLREQVAASVTTLRGGKGEVLLHAGEEVRGWYAVLNGLVKLQSESAEGRRQAFLGIPGGEWFGEGSVLKRDPRRYDVVALRETELLCLPRAQFEQLRAGSLPFCHALIEQFNMRLGQAIGTSTAYAEEAKDRPVHLQEVFATLYHNLGIDLDRTQLIDPAGRPQYLVEQREPIRELI